MYCTSCGKKFKDNESYCTSCGAKREEFSNSLEERTHSVPKTNFQDTSLVLGIISLVLVIVPVLSIPVAILAIIIGKNQQKETGRKSSGPILGIISLFLFVALFILLALTYYYIDNKTIDSIRKQRQNIIEEYNDNQQFDISGYSFSVSDNSTLNLNNNNTYEWYQDITKKEENYEIGEYEVYIGASAIQYIKTYLPNYNIDIYQYDDTQINSCYLIILSPSTSSMETKEATTDYYFGLIDNEKQSLNVISLVTKNKLKLTIKEKINKIDV